MEMQAFSNHFTNTGADAKAAHYSRALIHLQTAGTLNNAGKMKVLFSGSGKAEKNMGMAEIPLSYDMHIQKFSSK